MLLFFVKGLFLSLFATVSAYSLADLPSFSRAERYFNDSLYVPAIQEYRKVLNQVSMLSQPQHSNETASASFKIGVCYFRQNAFDASKNSFDEFVKQYPQDIRVVDALYNAAFCLKSLGKYNEASVRFSTVFSRFPTSGLTCQSLFEAADCSRKNKDIDQSILLMHKFLSLYSSSEKAQDVSIALMLLYIDKKDTASAEKLFETSVRAYAADRTFMARILYCKAELACVENRKNVALKYYSAMTNENVLFLEKEQALVRYSTCAQSVENFKVCLEVYAKRYDYYKKKGLLVSRDFLIAWADVAQKVMAFDVEEQVYRKICNAYPSDFSYVPTASDNVLEIDSLQKNIDKSYKPLKITFVDSSCAAESLYVLGITEIKQKNYSVAREQFKNILLLYPVTKSACNARYQIAQTYFLMRRYGEAGTYFRSFIRQAPPDTLVTMAKIYIAQCLAGLFRYKEACTVFDSLLVQNPSPGLLGTIYFEHARVLQKSGRLDDAVKQFEVALEGAAYPEKQKILMELATLYFDNRLYAKAEVAFEKAQESALFRNDSCMAQAGLISAFTMDGRQKESKYQRLDFLKRYGSDNVYFSDVVYHDGLKCIISKDYDNARVQFKSVIDNYKSSVRIDDATYQLALSYFYENKKSKALELFDLFVDTFPHSEYVGLAQFKIGMIYYEQNDFDRAVEYFSSVISLPETDSTTRFRAAYNAAIGLQKMSRWLEAAKMYELILDNFPGEISESSARLKIGFCLVQGSRYTDAIVQFAKATENANAVEKPEILYWIATCYARTGEFSRAVSEYLKMPVLYPGFSQWNLTSESEAARLLEVLGDYPKAMLLYKKIVSADGEDGQIGKQALMRIGRLSTIMENQ